MFYYKGGDLRGRIDHPVYTRLEQVLISAPVTCLYSSVHHSGWSGECHIYRCPADGCHPRGRNNPRRTEYVPSSILWLTANWPWPLSHCIACQVWWELEAMSRWWWCSCRQSPAVTLSSPILHAGWQPIILITYFVTRRILSIPGQGCWSALTFSATGTSVQIRLC